MNRQPGTTITDLRKHLTTLWSVLSASQSLHRIAEPALFALYPGQNIAN